MQVDDHYVYAFVRQDLSVAQQLVQLGHVMRRRGMLSMQEEGIPALVVIGMPHELAMHKVATKLTDANIGYNKFIDPDQPQIGMTAISTRPVSPAEKEVLKNYRMWNEANNTQVKRRCLTCDRYEIEHSPLGHSPTCKFI